MRLPVALLIAITPFFTGCSLTSTAPHTPESNSAPVAGILHGGRQPISGAELFMFAADQTAYNHASDSLIKAYTTGSYPSTLDTNAADPTYGDYYITTSSTGAFEFAAAQYSCTAGQQVYLYALGGNPGSGVNSAAGLLAVLGACQSDGGFKPYSSASEISYVNMNEISTIAAAYAFAGFATDAVHVSSSNTTLAATGLTNAFANAANLFTITSANNTVALTEPIGGNGTVPQTTIDTLANILAACVNSTGPSSTACSTLFEGATSNGVICTSPPCSTEPSDTASAAINLAHYPYTTKVSTVYNIVGSTAVPYEPALTTAPTAFTIALEFTGGGIDETNGIAIDGSGNAWIANFASSSSVNSGYGSVTELSSSGTVLSGASGYIGGGLNGPYAVAVDSSGNAWITNYNDDSITELTSDGIPPVTVIDPFTGNNLDGSVGVAIDGLDDIWIANSVSNPGVNSRKGSVSAFTIGGSGSDLSYSGGSMNAPYGIAIDGAANVWLSNFSGNSVTELSYHGAVLSDSGNGAYTGDGLNEPVGIAIDASGNAWIENYGGNSVTELSHSGAVLSDSGSGAYTGGGMNEPSGIAIDGSGNAWIANYASSNSVNSGKGSVTELSSSGTVLSGASGYIGGGLNVPFGIAIDGSGNAWIENYNNNSVTEFIGAATPVITPICAGLPSTLNSNGASTLGTKP